MSNPFTKTVGPKEPTGQKEEAIEHADTASATKVAALIRPAQARDSNDLEQSAAKAEEEINRDIKTYKRLLLKHGTNKDDLYYMLERLVDRILNHWASFVLLEEIRKLEDEGKTKVFEERLSKMPEIRRQQDCSNLESWMHTFDALIADIRIGDADFATINKQLRDFIDHLLSGMDLGQRIAGRNEKYLYLNPEIGVKLQNLRKTCEKDQYSIITVGLEKVGKSTLINNLIGFDLLPRAAERCTMITTIVKPSLSANLEIEILFFDREHFEANLEEAIREDSTLSSIKEEIIKNYNELGGKENLVISGEFSQVEPRLKEFVTNKNRAFSIKSVIVRTNKLKSEVPYEMFDVPGYDSTLSSHRQMAERAIQTADAFIFLTDGTRPSLTDRAVELLKKIEEMSPSKNMFERGFAVITNLEKCETGRQARSCMDRTRQELESFGFKPEKTYEVCAALEVLKAKQANRNVTQDELALLQRLDAVVKREMSFLKDGLAKFRDSLIGYMATDLPKARAKEAKDFGNDIKIAIQSLLDQLKKDFDFVRSTDPAVEKNKLRGKAWKMIWQNCKETANLWKRNNVTDARDTFFAAVVEEFKRDFSARTDEQDSKAVDLKDKVQKGNAMVGLVDVPKIEHKERKRLTRVYLQKVQKSIEVIGRRIYQKLEELRDEFRASLGVHQGLEDYFNIERIVPRETCCAQIEALVMRAGFPLLSYLRWGTSHENRKKALKELSKTFPDTEQSQ